MIFSFWTVIHETHVAFASSLSWLCQRLQRNEWESRRWWWFKSHQYVLKACFFQYSGEGTDWRRLNREWVKIKLSLRYGHTTWRLFFFFFLRLFSTKVRRAFGNRIWQGQEKEFCFPLNEEDLICVQSKRRK